MKNAHSIGAWLLLLAMSLSLGACEGCRREVRGKYYKSLETVGLEKREMLVKRVGKARNAQEKAQEQFVDALEQFQALVGHDGGELEAVYEKLRGEYEDAESRAQNVRERINRVENVAQALFDEWREEIAVFDNDRYRRESETKLEATKTRYSKLLTTMERASASMDPVLVKLRDQVLFLKHNLNAQALGSLDREAEILQADVGQLIEDMKASIAEADQFISEMSG